MFVSACFYLHVYIDADLRYVLTLIFVFHDDDDDNYDDDYDDNNDDDRIFFSILVSFFSTKRNQFHERTNDVRFAYSNIFLGPPPPRARGHRTVLELRNLRISLPAN